MLQSPYGASAWRSPAELWISLFLPSTLSPVTNSIFNLFPSPFSFVFVVDCIMVPKCSLYPDPSPCDFSILPTRGRVGTFYPLTLGLAVQLLWSNEIRVDMRQTVASSIPTWLNHLSCASALAKRRMWPGCSSGSQRMKHVEQTWGKLVPCHQAKQNCSSETTVTWAGDKCWSFQHGDILELIVHI